LKLEPNAKLVVMATRAQMDEMKTSEAPKPHAILEQPASIKMLVDVLLQPLMQEATSI